MTTRKRVSVRQMELLIEFLEENTGLARSRLKSKEGNALSSRLWAQCAAVLNAESDGDQRTPKEWNKWFNDYKCRLLSRIRQIKSRQTGTGGGPGDFIAILSPLDERMASLFGADNVVVGRSGTPQHEVQTNPLSVEPADPVPVPSSEYVTVVENVHITEVNATEDEVPDRTSRKGHSNKKEHLQEKILESNKLFQKRQLEMMEIEHNYNVKIAQLKIRKLELEIGLLENKNKK